MKYINSSLTLTRNSLFQNEIRYWDKEQYTLCPSSCYILCDIFKYLMDIQLHGAWSFNLISQNSFIFLRWQCDYLYSFLHFCRAQLICIRCRMLNMVERKYYDKSLMTIPLTYTNVKFTNSTQDFVQTSINIIIIVLTTFIVWCHTAWYILGKCHM